MRTKQLLNERIDYHLHSDQSDGQNSVKEIVDLSLKLNVPLDEILYLPVGQIVVFRRGQRPVFSTRFDTFNDEFYKEITQTKKNDQRSEEDR